MSVLLGRLDLILASAFGMHQAKRLYGLDPRVTPHHSAARKPRSLLLLSLEGAVPKSQTHPFHHFALQLGVSVFESTVSNYLRNPKVGPDEVDVAGFQIWIDQDPTELATLAGLLRQRHAAARIVCLDPMAPTDLRYAQVLDPYIDVYVKKHVLRDRNGYGVATSGDTNLSDWFGPYFGLTQSVRQYPVPESFLRKLVVGPTFPTAPHLWRPLQSDAVGSPRWKRSIDLHARFGGLGQQGWYGEMRRHAHAKAGALPQLRVCLGGDVPRWRFFNELANSKMCFSPFGYGEVCWRDYEAVIAGSMLLKPDMSHIESSPDIFIPGQTYVPLRWDLSDLEEKAKHYAQNDAERIRIAENALAVLSDYARSSGFVRQMAPVIGQVPT